MTSGTTGNASASGTGTIVDQDVTVTSPTANEGNNLVYTVTVAGSGIRSYSFVLGGTADAADHGAPVFSNGVTLAGSVLTVPNGVSNFTITIPTINDALDEVNETLTVSIGGVTGTGTITDNDATPTLAINDVTVNEAAGTATFTVTLSAGIGPDGRPWATR